jgi:lipopolysaccharide biosynthesis glycosyltransferase
MIDSKAAIAVAGDARFYPRIATLLRMLQDQPDVAGRHPVWIFTDDVSFSAAGAMLQDSLAHMGLVRGQDHDFHIVSHDDLAALPDRYPGISCYLRLWMPNAMAGYDRCLYLDVDVLLRHPLGPLLDTDLQGRVLGAIDEPGTDSARRLGLARAHTFNSGILLIDLNRWMAEDVSRRCLDWLLQNRDRVIWADQDALNAVLDTDVLDLDIRWNTLRNRVDEVPDPAIVHFNGAAKPWQYGTRHPYRDAYRAWLRRTSWAAPLMEHDTLRHRLRETPLYDLWQAGRSLTPQRRNA